MIVVLDVPLLDMGKANDLTGALIADIFLQPLSYVVQTEHEFIRQRQTEGIAASKECGVRFGLKPKTKPPQSPPAVLQAWQKNKISARIAA